DHSTNLRIAAEYELAGWGDDDFIEYLAARHRSRAASVLLRVKSDANRHAVGCSPQLWRMILDEMARDLSVTTVSQALRRCLAACSVDESAQFTIGEIAFSYMQG